mgnify:CR=1 FL=1
MTMTISSYDEARAFLGEELRRDITPTIYVCWASFDLSRLGSSDYIKICVDQTELEKVQEVFVSVSFMPDGRVYLGDELVKTSNGEEEV